MEVHLIHWMYQSVCFSYWVKHIITLSDSSVVSPLRRGGSVLNRNYLLHLNASDVAPSSSKNCWFKKDHKLVNWLWCEASVYPFWLIRPDTIAIISSQVYLCGSTSMFHTSAVHIKELYTTVSCPLAPCRGDFSIPPGLRWIFGDQNWVWTAHLPV